MNRHDDGDDDYIDDDAYQLMRKARHRTLKALIVILGMIVAGAVITGIIQIFGGH